MDQQIGATADGALLAVLLESLTVLSRTFYSLISIELADLIGDNLNAYLEIFYRYLSYTHPTLLAQLDDKPGPLEDIRAVICEIVDLLTSKYASDFTMLDQFVGGIWQLLMATGPQPRNDTVSKHR